MAKLTNILLVSFVLVSVAQERDSSNAKQPMTTNTDRAIGTNTDNTFETTNTTANTKDKTTKSTPEVPTAEEQCKSRGHEKRCNVPLCSVCYNLLCKSKQGSRAITGPAQDGTVCGYDNFCRDGECVFQPTNSSFIGETVVCAIGEIFMSPFC